MQSTTAAKRPKLRIVPSRYMQNQSKPSDDKENDAQSTLRHTMTPHTASTGGTSAPLITLPARAPAAASFSKPTAIHSSRAALSTLTTITNSRVKPTSAAPPLTTLAAASQTSPTENSSQQPLTVRRRTHDMTDNPPVSVVSHRSSLPPNISLPGAAFPPGAPRPQLSDLSLHCYETALLQSLHLHAAAERAHSERRQAAERQLGAVAAVLRTRLSEESQCRQRIARIQQSSADHYSLAAQHAAITPLLPLLRQAAEAHSELTAVVDAVKAQLRLDGVEVDLDKLIVEVAEAQSVVDEINELLRTECGSPSLASSLSALSPLATVSALLTECAPALSGVSNGVATLQDRVEHESSVAFAQLANSSEKERQAKRQETGGRWQW